MKLIVFWRSIVKNFHHDTHMHLDLYKNTEEVLNYITDLKSYTIAVTNLPVLYDQAIKKYKELKYIRFALGLHPELIHQYPEQIPLFFKRLRECRYIGEIGLDFKKNDERSKRLQTETFTKIIQESHNYGGKILSIHSRNAAAKVIDIIGPNFNGKVILHWFSGNPIELDKAIQNGYYFSINSDMVSSKKGRNIIENIPIDRILIESDGPFTKDTVENYNLEFMNTIIRALVEIKGINNITISKQLRGNFRNLIMN